MNPVVAAENVTASLRASSKLKYERGEQVVAGSLVEIPEIEVKIDHNS